EQPKQPSPAAHPFSFDSFYPKPSSSADSSGVPHTRQITAEQSPHTSGSLTARAQRGHHNPAPCGRFFSSRRSEGSSGIIFQPWRVDSAAGAPFF
ncbi:MAG TPA: hypothetical protein VFT88_12745, partial [Acidobacteriaceae bacterium]|nr:hypothetical protein [Acidobacteriaceae bacterium]